MQGNWANKKQKAIPEQFSELFESAKNNREQRIKKKKSPASQSAASIVLGGKTDLVEKKVDYNVECGCFGTKHPAINNCMKCGRVICALEGERPCPFCGTPVFSDETLEDIDTVEGLTKRMKAMAGEQGWVPVSQRDASKSQQIVTVEPKMIDLECDWFDSELNLINDQTKGADSFEEEEEEEAMSAPGE